MASRKDELETEIFKLARKFDKLKDELWPRWRSSN